MIYAFFDFDGTITSRDSFLDFVLYTFGPAKFAKGLLGTAPAFIAFALKRITNAQLKEAVLKAFFQGWEVAEFAQKGLTYSQVRLPGLIKESALTAIKQHQSQGHKVVIVTASIAAWIQSWCDSVGLELIATKLEEQAGRLTGNLDGKNCHGPEKVRRIKERFEIQDGDYIYAYGDTSGDTQMLELANERFYRHFH